MTPAPRQQFQSQSQGPVRQDPPATRTGAPGGGNVRLRVLHETRYRYASPVTQSRQFLHLTPRDMPSQRVTSHRIAVQPHAAETTAGTDFFGNHTTHAVITAPHQTLSVLAESAVELRARAFDPAACEARPWESVREALARPGIATLEAARYLFESPHVALDAGLAAYAAASFTPGRDLLPALLELNARIHDEFEFDSTATTVSTPLAEVLAHRRGVCQDFAHLMIGCLRTRGLPARYVSGYLLTQPPPGQPRLIGSDASHAWVSVYCPGCEHQQGDWIDFDPTNNCTLDRDHVTLGWGRDFSDVTPTRGVTLGGGDHELTVSVTVSPDDIPAA
jgi:transglutaminase-like putative cysteine protease